MNKATGFFLVLAALAAAGCSDKSNMRFTIESLTGAEGKNGGKPYIEADLVGNESDACATIQDAVAITLKLDRPGSIGPTLEGYVKNIVIDYYYYDPNNGQLKGPVPLLSARQFNFNQAITSAPITVPIVSYLVKSWSQGVPCSGVTGYPGGIIDRMVAKVTVNAEDSTGKSLSAQGSIMLYLYDYGPAPTSGMPCYGYDTHTAVTFLCN